METISVGECKLKNKFASCGYATAVRIGGIGNKIEYTRCAIENPGECPYSGLMSVGVSHE